MSDDDRETRNDREDHVRAGVVTHEEARGILRRFNASHWRNKGGMGECARYTIPADPRRDDDIRLSAYIARCERIEAAAREAVADAEREDFVGNDADALAAPLRVALAWPEAPR